MTTVVNHINQSKTVMFPHYPLLMAINTNPIGYILTAVLTIIVTLLVRKYENRQAKLRSSIIYNSLGSTIANDYWGNIAVLHNGKVVNHINFVTILIENKSNIDLKAFTIDIWCEPGNQILGSYAHYEKSGKVIYLDESYLKKYNDVSDKIAEYEENTAKYPDNVMSKELKAQLSWAQTNKSFTVPAFNRKSSIKFNFLIENFNGELPLLYAAAEQTGIELEITMESESNLVNRYNLMVIIGLILYSVGLFLLYFFFKEVKYFDLWMVVIGLLYYPLAYALIWLSRITIRAFS